MDNDFLVRLFEHNNWANAKIIEACLALSNEQLDTEPQSAVKGNIRTTLTHFVTAQRSYLSALTLPPGQGSITQLALNDLKESAQKSGEDLLALARGEQEPLQDITHIRADFKVEPWMIMVQAIHYAAEHREQIKSMLSTLGITPPEIDGWDFGSEISSIASK